MTAALTFSKIDRLDLILIFLKGAPLFESISLGRFFRKREFRVSNALVRR